MGMGWCKLDIFIPFVCVLVCPKEPATSRHTEPLGSEFIEACRKHMNESRKHYVFDYDRVKAMYDYNKGKPYPVQIPAHNGDAITRVSR